MATFELANDENGQPFELPPQAAGWRVQRLPQRGGGRPAVVRWPDGDSMGSPMVLGLGTTYRELLDAAGPGKYRLEVVDQHGASVKGVPAACTGQLSDDQRPERETSDDEEDEDDEDTDGRAPRRRKRGGGRNRLVAQLAETNARMAARALDQMTSVMSGVTQILAGFHSAGVTNRPLPPAPPPPVQYEDEDDEDEDDEDEDDDEDDDPAHGHPSASPPVAPNGGGPSAIPDVIQFAIKEAINTALPLIIEKLTSGGGIGGIPAEALLDWRKAARPSPVPAPTPTPAPMPAPASSAWRTEPIVTAPPPAAPAVPAPASYSPLSHMAPAPVVPTASSAATVTAGPAIPQRQAFSAPAAAVPAAAPGPSRPEPPVAPPVAPPHPGSVGVARTDAAPTAKRNAQPAPARTDSDTAGAAPIANPATGAVPAEAPSASSASLVTPQEAAEMFDAHFLAIWSALTETERIRASKLIGLLGPDERTALIAELANMSVSDAVARARAIVQI